jgi:hypothetical protein
VSALAAAYAISLAQRGRSAPAVAARRANGLLSGLARDR